MNKCFQKFETFEIEIFSLMIENQEHLRKFVHVFLEHHLTTQQACQSLFSISSRIQPA